MITKSTTLFYRKFFVAAVFTTVLLLYANTMQAQNCSVNAGVDKSICVGDVLRLDGNIGGPFDATTLAWSVTSQPAGASTVIANPNSFSTTAGTSLVVGTYTFSLTAKCGDGITSVDNVSIIVNPVPATPTQSGTNSFTCYIGDPIAISGTAPIAGETVSWSVANGSGTFSSPTSSTTNFTPIFPLNECSSSYSMSITYQVRNASGCTRSVTRTYTFSRKYTFSAIADPVPVCGTVTTLKGSCAGSGTGLWSVVSTPAGAPAPVIASTTSNITSVSGLLPGTYTFNYSVTSACGNESANVSVVVASGSGVSTANAGNNQLFCSIPATVALSGNSPAVGETGTWSFLNGGTAVTIANPSAANTTVSGLTDAGAPYSFIYTISTAGGCTTKDTVSIYKEPELTLVNNIFSQCTSSIPNSGSNGQAVRLGNFPFNQLDTVNVTITYISGPAASVTSVLGGGSSRSVVTFTNNNSAMTVGQSFTQKLWNTGNATSPNELYLSRGTTPDSYNYFLYFNANVSSAGTYKFKVSFATKCSTYVADAIIERGVSIAVNAGTDVALACNANSATLAGSIVDNYAYWTMVSMPAGATNPINSSNQFLRNPPISSLIPGTYVFRYYNSAGATCTQNSDDVKVVVSSTPPPVPNAGIDQTFCAGSVVLNGSAIPGGALGQWSVIAPAGAPVTFSDATVANPTVSGLLTGTAYTFRYTLTNGCGSNFDDVVITTTANTAPAKPTITAGGVNCSWLPFFGPFPKTISVPIVHGTLTGSQVGTVSVVAYPASSLTSWTQVSSTATTNTLQVTLNNDAAVSYIYCVSDASCAAQTYCDTATTYYFNNLVGSTINAGTDQNLCAVTSFPTTTTLSGSASVIDKKWSLVFSSNGQGVSIGSETGSSTSVTLPAAGTYKFKYEFISPDIACQPLSDYVTVIVSSPGSVAQAGADATVCNATGVFNLTATPLSVGTGKWEIEQVVAGVVPTITDITSPTSAITFSQSGTVVLRWNSYGANASCGPSSSDLVTLTYVAPARAGNDIALCSSTSANLNALNPAPATGTWSQIAGPNTATLGNATNPATLITGLIPGSYTFRWTVSNAGACTTTDDVLVNISTINQSANAGADLTACSSGANALSLNALAAPAGYTSTWALFSRPSGASAGTFSSTSNPLATYGAATVAGEYIFSWTISNGVCSSTDFVKIKLASICGNVFNDGNGLTDLTVNGTGTNVAGSLYVNLLDNLGNVVAFTTVNPDGTYNFADIPPNVTYSLQLTTNVGTVGQPAPAYNLPSGWVNTGENIGASLGNDGSVNSLLPVTLGVNTVNNTNFGIEQLPVSQNVGQSVNQPAGGIISAGTISTNVVGTDAEDGVMNNSKTIIITQLPSDGTIIYYGGTPLALNQTITGFNPALLSYSNIPNGTTSETFRYAFIDAAGKQGNSSNYTVNWLTPLPINLESFTGVAKDCNSVTINWKVSDAVNFSHFEIERSTNGINFKTLGIILYNAAFSNYHFSENVFEKGSYQYRLKMIDTDGKSKYSPVSFIRLDCNQARSILVFPNPAKDKITINGLNEGEQITMYNSIGQIVHSRRTTDYQLSIDMTHLNNGIYYIIVTNKSGVKISESKIAKIN